MQLKYVDTKEEIIAINRKSKHIEPHLHNALEIVCVTSGALELGVGQELYHMEKGDIGFVFPDVIHHYQVLTPGVNKATYLIASPFTIAKFADIMQSMAPEYPIIKAEKVEPEVYRVINAILETEQSDITVAQGVFASDSMQWRISPGGSIPMSRRSIPLPPPSSDTVTMAVRFFVYFFSPRSMVERPVPPPMASFPEIGHSTAICLSLRLLNSTP